MAGPIDAALMKISYIVKKKYKDEKLAEQIRKVSSYAHNAGLSEEDGFDMNTNHNLKAIMEMIQHWNKEYSLWIM